MLLPYHKSVSYTQLKMVHNPSINKADEFSMSVYEEDQLLEIANEWGFKTTFETTTLPVFLIKTMVEYSEIVSAALKSLLQFPTSYLCEAGFSAVTATKAKQRNKLNICNTLRVSLYPVIHRWNCPVAETESQYSHWFNVLGF